MGRLPERDARAAAGKGRFGWRPSNWMIALIFLIVFTVGPYLAFTKHIPFTGYGYTLKATFSNGVNISKKSPVRIAGVDVGEVIEVGREGNATQVTFTVDESGRPIHDDALAQIRPRIFLEGNFFIDLDPGSPSAPELASEETIPVSRTSTSVQLDEIFLALQSPVRADLSRLLESFGTALTHEPTPAEDVDQAPEVQGKTGAESLNGALRFGGDAGRYSAQVTNALLGTEPGDLSRLIAGTSRTFGAFAANEADLQGLIENFDTFTGALAAQSTNLSATIAQLAPTLRTAQDSFVTLNNTLPPLRSYAIQLRPAIAELPGLIQGAEPWIDQAYPLLSGREGGGVAKLLREATPGLAGAAQGGKAKALPQLNQIGACTTRVIVPTGNQVINDQFSTGGPNYREFFYYLVNFAGITQNFDGNGHYLKVAPAAGDVLTEIENPASRIPTDQRVFTYSVEAPNGIQPQLGERPGDKRDVRCYQNSAPDINGSPLSEIGEAALREVETE